MRRHIDQDVEISRGSAAGPALALVAKLQTRANIDPGRNLDVERMRVPLYAAALAGGTRLRDDRALAVAVAAGLRDREKALLKTHLTAAATMRAGARLGAGLGAGTAAGGARFEARDGDGFFAAGGGFLKAKIELVLQVAAAPRPAAPAAAAAGAEEVAEQVA